MEEPIIPLELGRMFLGDYPPLFYVEIAVRIAIIYGWTLLLIRWVGARGVAQLSMIELLLVIALGSAVGDSLFYEDVPILVALWVITLVVLVNKGLDKLISRSRRMEVVLEGRPLELVRDGAIVPEELESRDLGADEVKGMLRGAGIENLGEVRRAYLETNGALSVFRSDPPRPGLAIVPPQDRIEAPPLTDPAAAQDGSACCARCGTVAPALTVLGGPCPACGRRTWTVPRLGPGPGDQPEERPA